MISHMIVLSQASFKKPCDIPYHIVKALTEIYKK